MYPNLLSLLKKDIIIIIQIKKNKTGCCCSYKICFSQETQRQSNEFPMKDAGKMEKKMTAGVQEFQENGPDC